jgi:hypothetical protein
MFSQPFTRPTPPDRNALLTALRVSLPDVAGIRVSDQPLVLVAGTILVDKATPWLPADIAAAQTAIDAAANATPQLDAQHDVDNWDIEMKALVLALIDALNVIRANLPVPLPPITPAQAIAAIRAKAALL